MLTIGLALLYRLVAGATLGPFIGALVVVCALLTLISGLQYAARGIGALGSAKLIAGGGS